MTTHPRFLLLPIEVRLLIYHILFSNLRVTLASPNQLPDQGPWAIMRTCRTCYDESLPMFYALSTISLKHEASLHVLRRRIGPENMARLQCVVVEGFRTAVHEIMVVELPATLRKLYLGWKGDTYFHHSTPKSHLNNQQIREFLEWTFRKSLDPHMGELLATAPNLQIYLDTTIGNPPSNKDPASAETSRYALLSVEIARGHDGQEWSWGHIDRKIDRLMVEEPGW